MTRDLKRAPRKGWVVLHMRDGRTMIAYYNGDRGSWCASGSQQVLPLAQIVGWESYVGEPPKGYDGPRKPVEIIGGERALKKAQECVARRHELRARGKIHRVKEVIW